MKHLLSTFILSVVCQAFVCQMASAETKTWDGKYDTTNIEVTVVYFVPSDRKPLPDWRERVDYFSRRLELFHAREFQGQSTMKAIIQPTPFISEQTTEKLRDGDRNAIYYKTLSEAHRRLKFGTGRGKAFPILLVLSEINWRPLDDFYRLKPVGDKFVFAGTQRSGAHFPGAEEGGARAAYLAREGIGWGLVSADGWRVPYRGSDCVVYHEGCGHTVGLPHPEPINQSVMGTGQYHGWLNESYLDKEQKTRLGWSPKKVELDKKTELFNHFRALPERLIPKPSESVTLKLDLPKDANVKSLRVRIQTEIRGVWQEIPQTWEGAAPTTATLGKFETETPVSYRVDVELENGATAELWGYLQVRSDPSVPPQPK